MSQQLSASAALAAFAEPLCAGRRVLVLGSASAPLAELLLERGARLVHVADPDGPRASQAAASAASNKLSFSAWNDGSVALREAAFDLCIVENLAAFEPTRTLRDLKRLLGQRGVLIAASPNRDAGQPLLPGGLKSRAELDYYALYDAVAVEFPFVSMHGQAPFIGYAIAEFSPEGELEPVIDSSFLARGSEEPEFFVAVAGQFRPRTEAYAVVQLPIGDVLGSARSGADRTELERLRGGERQHRRRIAELEAMLKRSGSPAPVTSALEHKLARQDAWIRELEGRATTADERADQAEQELDAARQELDAARQELGAARQELGAARAAPPPPPPPAAPPAADPALAEQQAALEAELATLRQTLTQREERIAALLGVDDNAAGDELAGLERQLSERGQEVRRLEREVREAERIGRELLDRLKRGNGAALGASDGQLQGRLALVEADRQAAVWAAEALAERIERLAPKGH